MKCMNDCKLSVNNTCTFVPVTVGAHGSDRQLSDVRDADTQLLKSASVHRPVQAAVLISVSSFCHVSAMLMCDLAVGGRSICPCLTW